MPGFDGTGPMGMGPMTGGGRGPCRFYYGYGAWTPPFWGRFAAPAPWFGPWRGRGFGFGRGFGRGMGRGFGRGFGWRRWW